MDTTTTITLVTGSHCHLCEQAKAVLYPLIEARQIQLTERSVDEDQSLKDRYALRIPVLLLPDGREKGWPFTAAQIDRMLNQLS
ncbi:MAG: glutaredoxin family protein [Porticoccaceae bacterium]